MRPTRFIAIMTFVLILHPPDFALAQQEIDSVSFDEIPQGTRVLGGTQPIGLQGDTNIGGDLIVSGEISPGSGIRFPDGTLQVTASSNAAGASDLYRNQIPDVTPPNAFTEICLKDGATAFDVHSVSESTAGGNCLPGDTGWIVERFERDGGTEQTWAQARLACLQDGMRLLEAFEYEVTCDDAALFAVSDMTDGFEWSSNSAIPITGNSNSGMAASAAGNGGCNRSTWAWVGRSSMSGTTQAFRCAL